MRTTRAGLVAAALALAVTPLAAAPAVAEDVVTVTVSVRGPALTPLADVGVELFQHVDDDWDEVFSSEEAQSTGSGGTVALVLEPEATYTLRFDASAHGLPVQYLGGGPVAPAGPGSPDWDAATFVPATDPLGDYVRLHSAWRVYVAGLVEGDEEVELTNASVDLLDVTDGPHDDGGAGSALLEPGGAFAIPDVATGRRYTVSASAPGYLRTFLGDTTQPELAETFDLVDAPAQLETIRLRRGADVTGTVTSGGRPVELAQITALRWDPAGERWLPPTHYEAGPSDTGPDGSWQLFLEPGATYTIRANTRHATAPRAPVPSSRYLGGGTEPPSPDDPEATFTLLPSGAHVEWDLGLVPVPSTAPPRIAGKAVLGSRLTAAARWGVPPTTVTWQWLRDGRPVPGATSSTYTPTVADLGTRLTVRATARKADYAPATVTSTPTTPVAKAPATTRVKLSRSAARYGAKVRATVTVQVPAGTPSGTVTLRAGGKKVATARPQVSGTRATATFTLPALKAGTHHLTATTAASSTVAASTSPSSTLKITRAKAKVKVKGPRKWRLAKGKRPTVTVTVKGAKGAPTPRGKVVVKIGSKKFTKTLTKGKVKVRGPRLKKRGTVKVSVTYRPAAKTYTKPAKVKAKIQVR